MSAVAWRRFVCGALIGFFALAVSPLASAEVAVPASRGAAAVARPQQRTDLQRQTGLTVTIDDIEPVALVKGQPLTVTGTVSNDGTTHWRDAQVYLEIGPAPATTRAELSAFASQQEVVGTRIVRFGLFDQIGSLSPGDTSSYRLSVPFHLLPITGAPGAYHVGVSVLAANTLGGDAEADAVTDTVVPLLPTSLRNGFRPTSVLTLLPVTAPVLRHSNGNFLNDKLVAALSPGGRLSDVLGFALQAPRDSVQVVIDPALRAAVHAMGQGYVVQTVQEAARGQPGRPGLGQPEAATWERELKRVARRQQVSVMTWGAPDASALAANGMPGIVESAVLASRAYAQRNSLDASILGWQPGGFSTRRGLAVARKSGTSVQVVAERSLVRLSPTNTDYPPCVVTLRTRLGPLTALVTRRDVAGEQLTTSTSALMFRQDLVAEATVRSLLDDPRSDCAIFALPFNWDPGVAAGTVDLSKAYRLPSVQPTTAGVVNERQPATYTGRVEVPAHLPAYPTDVLRAVIGLRNNGRILTGMLSNRERATDRLNEQLGEAGSAAWRSQPRVAAAMIRQQAAAFANQIAKVTVTGPTFVALSSASGRFPITVTNGLNVPITVRVHVRPLNPALQVNAIENLRLAAGQRRDVPVVSRSAGSGLTQVRVRLSTPDHRLFGTAWSFNVRATQFGVVIWIAMGAGAAVLFGAAAVRIYRRVAGSRAASRPAAGPEPGAR